MVRLGMEQLRAHVQVVLNAILTDLVQFVLALLEVWQEPTQHPILVVHH